MQYKKVYMPVDGIKNHADFEIWYEDGELFLTVRSLNKEHPWSTEKDRVELISRHGAQMGLIKPDNKAIEYDVRIERWTYTLHTYVLFKHYYFRGMLWDIHGSLDHVPLKFTSEKTNKSDVRITYVKQFRDKGPCYEIKVRDISKLRVAAGAVIAIGLKEEYRGASEGEKEENKGYKMKGIVLNDEEHDIARHMERDLGGKYIPVSLERDKVTLKGNIVTLEEIGLLANKINALISEMGVSLHSGRIPQNPVNGKNHDKTCEFCDYRSVCMNVKEVQCRELEELDNRQVLDRMKEEQHA